MDEEPEILETATDEEHSEPDPSLDNDIAYGDPEPTSLEELPDEPQAPDLPREDEQATAVLRVCRHELNTINTHPAGFHWFSA